MSTDWKQKQKPEPKQEPEPPPYTPIWMSVIGWIISLLPGLAFLVFGVLKLARPDLLPSPEGMPDNGWKQETLLALGIIEVVGAVLYLFPYTALLGAIIMTGYLGGAVATHVRIGDAFAPPFVFGMLVWLGLVFRDARLRAMLPVRGLSTEPAGPSGCLSFIGVFLLTIIVVVGIILGISHALPADYHLARSKTIDAPPSQVFPHVADFNKWQAWTPFIENDPNINITIEGKPGQVGSVYKWTGNHQVGSGSMKITEIVPNERIKIQLDFIAPFPHTAEAEYKFKDEKDKTVVTWSMSGNSDSLHKAIRSLMSMEMGVGPLFDKGLDKMKAAVESPRSDTLPD